MLTAENTLSQGSNIVSNIRNLWVAGKPSQVPNAGKIPVIGKDIAPGSFSKFPENHPAKVGARQSEGIIKEYGIPSEE